MRVVELPEQRQPVALRFGRDVFQGRRRAQMGDRLEGTGIDNCALVGHWQESRAEIALLIVGQAPRVWQNDECRQIVGFAAERVAYPRAETREAGQEKAGVHQITAGTVNVGLRYHRHDKSQIVHAPGEIRQQTAYPATALAMLLELEGRLEDLTRFAGGRLDPFAGARVELLSVAPQQFGFVIEQIHLARAAVHEELNHAPGARRVMRSVAQNSCQRRT